MAPKGPGGIALGPPPPSGGAPRFVGPVGSQGLESLPASTYLPPSDWCLTRYMWGVHAIYGVSVRRRRYFGGVTQHRKTTLCLYPEQDQALRDACARSGHSISSLVRACIDLSLAEAEASPLDPQTPKGFKTKTARNRARELLSEVA